MTTEPNGAEGPPRRPAPRAVVKDARWTRGEGAAARAARPSPSLPSAPRLRALDRAIAELAGKPLGN